MIVVAGGGRLEAQSDGMFNMKTVIAPPPGQGGRNLLYIERTLFYHKKIKLCSSPDFVIRDKAILTNLLSSERFK